MDEEAGPTWHDAAAADGPLLVAWLEKEILPQRRLQAPIDNTTAKRLQEWKQPGACARFMAVDRMLIALRCHPSQVPDHIWRTSTWEMSDRPRSPRAVLGPGIAEEPYRLCRACSEPIPKVTPSGANRSVAAYRKLIYCGRSCTFEGQTVSPAYKRFLTRKSNEGKARKAAREKRAA